MDRETCTVKMEEYHARTEVGAGEALPQIKECQDHPSENMNS